MKYCHSKFSSLAFIKSPKKITIDEYLYQYISFCLPQNEGLVPIVFLGGAFQSFMSFKKDVQVLMKDYPVILLDLPSQGNNEQLSENLSFSDFAHLLYRFTDVMGIDKITPIALSYGSATGICFADKYPDRVEKLIIGGTTPRIRSSINHLLEATFQVLDAGDMETFGEGVVMNLVNFSKRDKTQIKERILKSFTKSMVNLSDNAKERYKQNTKRLLNVHGLLGRPQCETLVFTGEYDNFTTPFENAQVAKSIKRSKFVLVENGDHLASLERRDEMINLYKAFLKERPLDALDGIRVVSLSKDSWIERRLDRRINLENCVGSLYDERKSSIPCKVLDINYYGCQLEINENDCDWAKAKDHFDLEISGADIGALSVFPMMTSNKMNCVFRRGSFYQGNKLEGHISSLLK